MHVSLSDDAIISAHAYGWRVAPWNHVTCTARSLIADVRCVILVKHRSNAHVGTPHTFALGQTQICGVCIVLIVCKLFVCACVMVRCVNVLCQNERRPVLRSQTCVIQEMFSILFLVVYSYLHVVCTQLPQCMMTGQCMDGCEEYVRVNAMARVIWLNQWMSIIHKYYCCTLLGIYYCWISNLVRFYFGVIVENCIVLMHAGIMIRDLLFQYEVHF